MRVRGSVGVGESEGEYVGVRESECLGVRGQCARV